MTEIIKVAILDDHLAIVDGYVYRLGHSSNIEVVATAHYGEELEWMLERHDIDILILDLDLPISAANKSKYPISLSIPKILQMHPDMQILVISMHDQRALIKMLMENGASGYILKDDYESISRLGEIITAIYNGEMFISDNMYEGLRKKYSKEKAIGLSKRQYEILSICTDQPDIKTKDIAIKLNIAHSTVRNNLSKVYLKLGVRTRHAAILKAQEEGYLAPKNNPPIDPTND